MHKKSLLVVLVLLLACTFSVSAAALFDIGSVNYYSFADLEAEDYEAFIPGLRAQFFLSDFLGVSGDFMYLGTVYPYTDVYQALLSVNAVLRIPLGLLEPYVATGPAYYMIFDEAGDSEISDSVAYNVRGGLDINLLSWLSIGAELNFYVDDVVAFFQNVGSLTEDYIKAASLIGITAKVRF
jgi:hypothetical protein